MIIVNVVLNYWLLPKFGYQAAAYITLVTYFLSSLTLYLVSNYYYHIKIDFNRIFTALIIIPLLYFIVNYFKDINILTRTTIAFVVLLLFHTLFLNKEERKQIAYFFKNLSKN